MNPQDKIDEMKIKLEEKYNISIDPIKWKYHYKDVDKRLEEIAHNFYALEWLDSSDTEDNGIIVTFTMKEVEFKTEDLEYEIWLLLEQCKYQLKDCKIIPKFKEGNCELYITKIE